MNSSVKTAVSQRNEPYSLNKAHSFVETAASKKSSSSILNFQAVSSKHFLAFAVNEEVARNIFQVALMTKPGRMTSVKNRYRTKVRFLKRKSKRAVG